MPGLIGSIRRFFQPPPAPCAGAGDQGLHLRDQPFSLNTPARGDAFFFMVGVHIFWCAKSDTARGTAELRADVAAERFAVQERAHQVIRRAARDIEPYLPRLAEEAINEALAREFGRPVHECDDVTVEVRIAAEVRVEQAIHEFQRRLGHRLLDIHAKSEVTRAMVTHMGGERDQWRGFLSEGMDDWMARFAVTLAEEPRGVAKVMTAMQEERRADAERFLHVVEAVVAAQKTTNVYDLAVASDGALRVALERLGVPVPPPMPGVSWLED